MAGVHVIFRDITVRKQVEEALRAEKEKLERLDRVTMDREQRVLELKREVNELLVKLGQPIKYTD